MDADDKYHIVIDFISAEQAESFGYKSFRSDYPLIIERYPFPDTSYWTTDTHQRIPEYMIAMEYTLKEGLAKYPELAL